MKTLALSLKGSWLLAALALAGAPAAGGCSAHNVIGAADGGPPGGDGSPGTPDGPPGPGLRPGPMCTATAATETSCSGGSDEDCDGFVDCLDTECDGQPCGDGLTCSGGACRKPCTGPDCVPELPAIQNVRVTTRPACSTRSLRASAPRASASHRRPAGCGR